MSDEEYKEISNSIKLALNMKNNKLVSGAQPDKFEAAVGAVWGIDPNNNYKEFIKTYSVKCYEDVIHKRNKSAEEGVLTELVAGISAELLNKEIRKDSVQLNVEYSGLATAETIIAQCNINHAAVRHKTAKSTR